MGVGRVRRMVARSVVAVAATVAAAMAWLVPDVGAAGPTPPIPGGVNIAIGASTAGSSQGWGGGALPQDMVDGAIAYSDTWAHGLAFTGGQLGWAGPCGVRQAVVDFGAARTFSAARVWHHGPYAEHVPTTYDFQYFNGSAWVSVGGTSSVRPDLDSDLFYPGYWAARPTEHLFPAVTGTKARFTFDNCQLTTGHGWIYELEVFSNSSGGTTTTTTSAPHRCDGQVATIVGTNGDDFLVGTNGRDVIVGLGGNDRIDGGRGSDIICGGEGNDIITGDTSANDPLAGQDKIFGEGGNDYLAGCGGRDHVSGGPGNDFIGGDDFNAPGPTLMCPRTSVGPLLADASDQLDGGDGDDQILGGDGSDNVMGGSGDDFLAGNDGSDNLVGGPGNDVLQGDTPSGFLGGADRCIGGPGFDTADLSCDMTVLAPQ